MAAAPWPPPPSPNTAMDCIELAARRRVSQTASICFPLPLRGSPHLPPVARVSPLRAHLHHAVALRHLGVMSWCSRSTVVLRWPRDARASRLREVSVGVSPASSPDTAASAVADALPSHAVVADAGRRYAFLPLSLSQSLWIFLALSRVIGLNEFLDNFRL